MSKFFGIDTSRWQGDFDFKSAKDNENINFSIIKAGGADDGLYEDREFENKQFEYQKKQNELEDAWKRVDELDYVDTEASTILGVSVGTLSKDAREAKE